MNQETPAKMASTIIVKDIKNHQKSSRKKKLVCNTEKSNPFLHQHGESKNLNDKVTTTITNKQTPIKNHSVKRINFKEQNNPNNGQESYNANKLRKSNPRVLS